jgi:hypothetical protein
VSAADDTTGADSDVFAGLSRTRPQRPSARREQAKKSASKASGAAKKTSAAKAAPANKAQAGKPAPAKTRQPPAAAIPPVPRSGYATPNTPAAEDGGDVVGAAVQAITELAQLGAGAGAGALRSLLGRLPKP